jgi:hypothetical protein
MGHGSAQRHAIDRQNRRDEVMTSFYDAYGKPSPNGAFEKIDGNLILRDGRKFSVPINLSTQFHDSAGAPLHFTDAERSFADSSEGAATIARARMVHDAANGHFGPHAPAFTDAMAANVVRSALADKASSGAMTDRWTRDAATAQSASAAAYREMTQHLLNAHN